MTSPGRTTLGLRLLAARRRGGLTREQLAVRAGLSEAGIAQIETGRRAAPRPETLTALADTLGLSVDYLLGRDAARPLLRHHALVYTDVDDFVAAAGRLLAEGLDAGDAALVVTKRRNADALRDHLGDAASRVQFGAPASWRSALARYREFVAGAIEDSAMWVRIVAEPLGRNPAACSRYESLLTLAFAGHPLTLACAYDERSLPEEVVRHAQAAHPDYGLLT